MTQLNEINPEKARTQVKDNTLTVQKLNDYQGRLNENFTVALDFSHKFSKCSASFKNFFFLPLSKLFFMLQNYQIVLLNSISTLLGQKYFILDA